MSNFTQFTWNWRFLVNLQDERYISLNDLTNFISTVESNLKPSATAEAVLKELKEIFNEKIESGDSK